MAFQKTREWLALLVFVAAILLPGCGSYSLRGRVIEGGSPMILFVPEDDPSLEYGQPVPEAMISLTRDPDQLNRETVAQSRSGPSGWFAMPVDAFGAGWMDEMWEISARAGRHHGVEHRLRLPGEGDGMVMLIIMSPGFDPGTNEENLMEQFERFR